MYYADEHLMIKSFQDTIPRHKIDLFNLFQIYEGMKTKKTTVNNRSFQFVTPPIKKNSIKITITILLSTIKMH